jgi:hypothetical protein
MQCMGMIIMCVGVVLIFHSLVVRCVVCKGLLDVALNFMVCTMYLIRTCWRMVMVV